MDATGHTVIDAESFTGLGKLPALTMRHTVEAEHGRMGTASG